MELSRRMSVCLGRTLTRQLGLFFDVDQKISVATKLSDLNLDVRQGPHFDMALLSRQ
jgi:hypothetical protein